MSSTTVIRILAPRESYGGSRRGVICGRPQRFGIRLGGRLPRALYRCVHNFRRLSCCLRALDGQQAASLYSELFSDPIYQSTVVNTVLFLGIAVNLKMFFALAAVGFFHAARLVGQSAVDDLRAALGGAGAANVISIHWMLNGEWGLLNNAIYQLFHIDGPAWLD